MIPIQKFEIVELEEFTGLGATIYSIVINDNHDTLYDQFLAEYSEQFADEINDIVNRLYAITKLGAPISLKRTKVH